MIPGQLDLGKRPEWVTQRTTRSGRSDLITRASGRIRAEVAISRPEQRDLCGLLGSIKRTCCRMICVVQPVLIVRTLSRRCGAEMAPDDQLVLDRADHRAHLTGRGGRQLPSDQRTAGRGSRRRRTRAADRAGRDGVGAGPRLMIAVRGWWRLRDRPWTPVAGDQDAVSRAAATATWPRLTPASFGRDPGVGEHPEPGGLELGDEQAEQQHVLEHAAGQRDGVQAGGGARVRGRARRAGRPRPRVEPGGDHRDVDARRAGRRRPPPDQVRPVQHARRRRSPRRRSRPRTGSARPPPAPARSRPGPRS